MAIEFIPPGTENCSAIGAADGNTIKSIEGGQRITGLSKAARNFHELLLGEKSQIRTDITDPLIADFDTNALSATAPSGIVDARTGAQAFHFTPGGPNTRVQLVRKIGNSKLQAVGASGRIMRWDAGGGEDFMAGGVRLDALNLMGSRFTAKYNSNAMTDIRAWDGSLISERGFSGTAEFLAGSSALFQLADSSGSLPTGATMKIFGGRVQWMLGNITTLWLLDGEFDLSQAPKDLTITTLYISRKMKRSKWAKLASQHAAVTLPSTVGTDLFVLGDIRNDLVL